jgi:hypothetical protein
VIDGISTQLARTIRLQERLLGQVCDGDLTHKARQEAEVLYHQTDEIRQDLQSLYGQVQART